jgi:hypothetical protein
MSLHIFLELRRQMEGSPLAKGTICFGIPIEENLPGEDHRRWQGTRNAGNEAPPSAAVSFATERSYFQAPTLGAWHTMAQGATIEQLLAVATPPQGSQVTPPAYSTLVPCGLLAP